MEQKILASTKKVLQIGLDDESFDLDVMTHINSAFSTLHDVGVGPDDGFVLDTGDETWADFEPELVKQSKIKTYVYLYVRLLFDPPATQFLLASSEKILQEQLWRISTNREQTEWTDPDPPNTLVEEVDA